jgi:hypothetical protein
LEGENIYGCSGEMEILRNLLSLLFLLGLISVPVLLFFVTKVRYRIRFAFITYLVSGLILTAGIMCAFAWWADYSRELDMIDYGYDFDGMNTTERFQNVDRVNLEKVKQLEIGYYGIGWSLKAIMSYVFYSPYLLLVYAVGVIIRKVKGKNGELSWMHRPI